MRQRVDSVWRDVAWVFTLSRLIMVVVGCFAIALFAPVLPGPVRVAAGLPLHTQPNGVVPYLLAWWHWDATFYVQIASQGYWPRVAVFFPLWPLIIHISGWFLRPFFTGDTAYYLAGVITANILFYIALVLLYKIIAKEWSTKIARITILSLSCSPYALFFFAGYTESLFLCLCVATFFFLRREGYRNWWLAILFAALASLTRETGILLTIPFLVVLVRRFWPVRKDLLAHWRSILRLVLPLAFIPLGVIGYMLYLYQQYGNPLLFVTAAIGWKRHPVLPGVSIYTDLVSLITEAVPFTMTNLTDLLFTLGALIIILISLKKLPLEYSLFSLASWLFFTSTLIYSVEPLTSYPRYATVIFPMFILGASWLEKRPILKYSCISLSILFLSLNVCTFVRYAWVA